MIHHSAKLCITAYILYARFSTDKKLPNVRLNIWPTTSLFGCFNNSMYTRASCRYLGDPLGQSEQYTAREMDADLSEISLPKKQGKNICVNMVSTNPT